MMSVAEASSWDRRVGCGWTSWASEETEAWTLVFQAGVSVQGIFGSGSADSDFESRNEKT